MEITLKTIYAVQVVQALSKSPLCILRTELAAQTGIPPEYIAQVVQPLIRAGIVESLKGPGGGYALARAVGKIKLADVVVAVYPGLVEKEADDTPAAARIRSGIARVLMAALSAKGVADL